MIKTEYKPKDYDVFIGIDVDSKSYAFTEMDHNIMVRSKKMSSSADKMVKYVQKRFSDKRVLCAYEAGGTGYELHDILKENNISCWVVSPNTISRPANSAVKNNRIDSRRIAQAMKTRDAHPIRVPSLEYRELRHLIRSYDNYAKAQAVAKNRIKALLLFESLYKNISDERKWTGRFLKEIEECSCTKATRIRLDGLMEDLEYARGRLAKTLKIIKEFCNSNGEMREYIEYLKSIPGIGMRTASYILGKLGDPRELRTCREIGSFFGLTPKERSTGERVVKGSISHNGSGIARSLLVEASWVTIRYDKELRQFYDRIRSRNPKESGAQKAIIAVARKLTARIYAVLKNKKKYIVIH